MKRNRRRARGSTAQRGYGAAHQALRRELAELVTAGLAFCARCGEFIEPDEPWDLDHDNSRLFYVGPSHAYCNRAAANELRTSGGPGSPRLSVLVVQPAGIRGATPEFSRLPQSS